MSFNQTNSPPRTYPFDTPSIGDEPPLNLIWLGEWVRDQVGFTPRPYQIRTHVINDAHQSLRG